MAQFRSNIPAVVEAIRGTVKDAATPSVQRARDMARGRTPRSTSGRTADSVHGLVVDENGSHVGGDTIDGNGNSVPDYPPTGAITMYVGSNTAPLTVSGRGYFDIIEMGGSGSAGAAPLGQSVDTLVNQFQTELAQKFPK